MGALVNQQDVHALRVQMGGDAAELLRPAVVTVAEDRRRLAALVVEPGLEAQPIPRGDLQKLPIRALEEGAIQQDEFSETVVPGVRLVGAQKGIAEKVFCHKKQQREYEQCNNCNYRRHDALLHFNVILIILRRYCLRKTYSARKQYTACA